MSARSPRDSFTTYRRSQAGPPGGESARGEELRVYTVGELTREVKGLHENELGFVWVVGEISNARRPSSGHIYLTLKDESAQLQAVVFRGVASRLRFDLEDGLEVTAFGRLTVYEPRGQYQIIVERLEPKGLGALQLAFEQLKKKLQQEGLFDPVHKKPIPSMPATIGVVTSATGAALRDILNVIERRFPRVRVLLNPVRVQGEGAAAEIAQAVREMNEYGGIDVLIVGRGGGSLEDLWVFNEEVVARAIFASQIPVISAVGHEIDVTIADFVADKRALTPTEAAELAVPREDVLLESLDALRTRLAQALSGRLAKAKQRLEAIGKSYAFRQPVDRIRQRQQRLDEVFSRLNRSVQHSTHLTQERLGALGSKLEALSPLGILERGYSLTTRGGERKPLRSAEALVAGDEIETTLHEGLVVSTVARVVPPNRTKDHG